MDAEILRRTPVVPRAGVPQRRLPRHLVQAVELPPAHGLCESPAHRLDPARVWPPEGEATIGFHREPCASAFAARPACWLAGVDSFLCPACIGPTGSDGDDQVGLEVRVLREAEPVRVRDDARRPNPFVDSVVHVPVDPEPQPIPLDHVVQIRREGRVDL